MQNILQQTYLYLSLGRALRDLEIVNKIQRDKIQELMRPCILNMLNKKIQEHQTRLAQKMATNTLKKVKCHDKNSEVAEFSGRELMNSQFEDSRYGNMKYKNILYHAKMPEMSHQGGQSNKKSEHTKKSEKGQKYEKPQSVEKHTARGIIALQLYCKDDRKGRSRVKDLKKEARNDRKVNTKGQKKDLKRFDRKDYTSRSMEKSFQLSLPTQGNIRPNPFLFEHQEQIPKKRKLQ